MEQRSVITVGPVVCCVESAAGGVGLVQLTFGREGSGERLGIRIEDLNDVLITGGCGIEFRGTTKDMFGSDMSWLIC